MDLTTLARVKTGLGIANAQHDTLLSQLIAAVSMQAEKYMERHTLQTARTEQYTIERGDQLVFLRGYPVLASPAAVFKNDVSRDFVSAVAIDTSAYYLDLEQGRVDFDQIALIYGKGVFQAAYTGGMAADTAAFIVAFPDVAHAVDLQVEFLFQRRDNLGLNSFSAEGGSVGFAPLAEWLPASKATLERHRRVGILY